MKEILISHQKTMTEEGKEFFLKYFLLIQEIEIENNLICENYGVKVSINGGEEEDTAEAPNITMNATPIHSLLDLLSRNPVTPVSLADVLEDWL